MDPKGDLSVRAAGQRGGQARKDQLGAKGYVDLGRKGGKRVADLIRRGREDAEAKGDSAA